MQLRSEHGYGRSLRSEQHRWMAPSPASGASRNRLLLSGIWRTHIRHILNPHHTKRKYWQAFWVASAADRQLIPVTAVHPVVVLLPPPAASSAPFVQHAPPPASKFLLC